MFGSFICFFFYSTHITVNIVFWNVGFNFLSYCFCLFLVQEGPEAALDSHALALVANLGRQRAQALNTAFVKFDTNQFAEKLVRHSLYYQKQIWYFIYFF